MEHSPILSSPRSEHGTHSHILSSPFTLSQMRVPLFPKLLVCYENMPPIWVNTILLKHTILYFLASLGEV